MQGARLCAQRVEPVATSSFFAPLPAALPLSLANDNLTACLVWMQEAWALVDTLAVSRAISLGAAPRFPPPARRVLVWSANKCFKASICRVRVRVCSGRAALMAACQRSNGRG